MDEQAAASDEAAVAKCSEATLHGTYLFAYDGVQIRGNNKGPFATAGYQVHDGKQKLNGVETDTPLSNRLPHQPLW
jgi:hypothetical protein